MRTGAILRRVPIQGGTAVTITQAPQEVWGATWLADGNIVFGTVNGGLYRVSSDGGEPELLTNPSEGPNDVNHMWPAAIRGTDAVLFAIRKKGGGTPLSESQLAVLDMSTGSVIRLGLAGTSPQYVRTGHLVYVDAEGTLQGVGFDVESLEVVGRPVPLVENVTVKLSGAADYGISENGSLVYATGGSRGAPNSVVWVDRTGREEPIPIPPRAYFYARVSPSGDRVALDVRGMSNDIWTWDFSTQTSTRLILGEGSFTYPTWTPDGERIAYASEGETAFYWKASNNTGDPELLVDDQVTEGGAPNPYFFTPDGSALVYRDEARSTAYEVGADLFVVSLVSDAPPRASPGWQLQRTQRGAFTEWPLDGVPVR